MNEIAYFDNAATTYTKPQIVHDFMHSFYSANSINVGRGNYSISSNAASLVGETRDMLLKLFNASRQMSAVFTPTATIAINIILQGLNFESIKTVYISPFEHNSVVRTLKHLTTKYQFEIIQLEVNRLPLAYNIEGIKRQFATKTPDLVIVAHASNVCGLIAPIDEIGQLAKAYKSIIMLDCCQTAGLLDINIESCKSDYIVFAGHKSLYGPLGCSGFICNKNTKLKPFIYGGTGIDSASDTMPLDIPARFEAGSQNIMAIAGLNAALKWIDSIGKAELLAKEKDNYLRLTKMLSIFSFIEQIGTSDNTVGIISTKFKTLSADNVGNILSEQGVMVRTGLHCSPLAHQFLGTYPSGTVRFSVGYFTSEYDFEKLENVLKCVADSI